MPPHKRDIRLGRAKANLERVKRNTAWSLIHSTPPPALVVPLLQDVLRSVGIPVSVVFEEADTACARMVVELCAKHESRFGTKEEERKTEEEEEEKECFLLSLDSDLHCFDLGAHGYYLPLDSLIVSDESLTGTVFNFAVTQTALGVNLVSLAALMGAEGTTEAPRPASEGLALLKRGGARDQHVDDAELERVRAQFSTGPGPTVETHGSLVHSHSYLAESGRLYGRFAEVLVGEGEMWLPQLLEDHSRPSAWDAGLSLRITAYNLIGREAAPPVSQSFTVTEWLRRADCISGKVVPLDRTGPVVDLPEPLTKISLFVFCMTILLASSEKEGKRVTQHEFHALIVMINGTYPSRFAESTRELLHLTARWQAIVFSATLLAQASRVPQWPILSEMYDLQTFLVALKLLRQGHTLAALTLGHEALVGEIMDAMGETFARHARTKKSKRQRRALNSGTSVEPRTAIRIPGQLSQVSLLGDLP